MKKSFMISCKYRQEHQKSCIIKCITRKAYNYRSVSLCDSLSPRLRMAPTDEDKPRGACAVKTAKTKRRTHKLPPLITPGRRPHKVPSFFTIKSAKLFKNRSDATNKYDSELHQMYKLRFSLAFPKRTLRKNNELRFLHNGPLVIPIHFDLTK